MMERILLPMCGLCASLFADRRGATAVEYGLICSLIVIAAIGGAKALGASNGGAWGNIANKVAAVTPS